MKKIILPICLLFIALIQGCSTVPKTEALFRDVKVQLSPVFPPCFNNVYGNFIPGKRMLKWIQIDVDYRSAVLTDPQTKDPVWLEDVSMKYVLLFPREVDKPRVVFSGEVTYEALPMDGKIHHAQVFLRPQYLRRYTPLFRLHKNGMKYYYLMVIFEINGKPIGGGVYKPRSTTKASMVRFMIEKALTLPSTIEVEDVISPRNETPWKIINPDRYELIKRKD